ncbi:hypothetical protein MBANPS3_012389 [Mucor bainieri]
MSSPSTLPMDLSQLIQFVQQQRTSLTERVQQHDGLLARLNLLEKENGDLKKVLKDKDLVTEKLQSQLSATTPTSASLLLVFCYTSNFLTCMAKAEDEVITDVEVLNRKNIADLKYPDMTDEELFPKG